MIGGLELPGPFGVSHPEFKALVGLLGISFIAVSPGLSLTGVKADGGSFGLLFKFSAVLLVNPGFFFDMLIQLLDVIPWPIMPFEIPICIGGFFISPR